MSDLARRIWEASAILEGMTPEQKEAMWKAQRRSWVVGELMLEHPELSREKAEAIYDKAEEP